MSRFIPLHPKKGSPEAKAWGAKMRALRTRRGPTKRRRNPEPQTGFPSWPVLADYLGNEGWKPLGKKGVVAFSRRSGSLFQIIQKEAREWRVLYRTFLTAASSPALSLGTYDTVDRAMIAANRQASDWSEKNPKDFHNIEKSGFRRGEYVGYGGGTWKIRKYGTGERLWIAVKQGGGGEFYGSSFADLSAKLDALASKKNPGEAYHVLEAEEAHKIVRRTDDPDEKVFYAGVESAHRISASSAKRLGMNRPRTRRIPSQRRRGARSNPLAVFGVGNPPKRLNTGIAGVVYSRCLEIRAEKLKYKPGLYRHPFSKSSGVQVLALDNGDMLVHSTRGVNLWKPI